MRIKMDENRSFVGEIESCAKVEQVDKYDPKRAADEPPEQDVNSDGVPLWFLHCTHFAEGPFGSEATPIKVKVASVTEPAIPVGGTPIFFGGLVLNVNVRQRGGFAVSWSAETFTTEPPPSTRRATASAPEAETTKAKA